MDLNAFAMKKDADSGVLLELDDPSGSPLFLDTSDNPEHTPVERMGLMMLGIDSPVYQEHYHANQTRRMAQGQKIGKVTLDSKKLDDEALDILIRCTVGFQNIQLDGQMLDCTPENVRILYARFPFIRDQAAAFMNERSHFLGE